MMLFPIAVGRWPQVAALSPAAGGGGGTDPDFSSVKLLCGFDGADAATSSTDDSSSAHSLVFAGNAQLDTAQQKFGSASLLLDGTGDGILINNSADFQFGAGQFTIEMFARWNALPGSSLAQWLVALYDGNNQRSWGLGLATNSGSSRRLQWTYSTAGTSGVELTGAPNFTPSTDTWYHIAADRDASNVLRLYANGSMAFSSAHAVTFHNSTGKLSIGGFTNTNAMAGNYMNGWIDELRITKGIARYGSDSGFTVPTAAYPRS